MCIYICLYVRIIGAPEENKLNNGIKLILKIIIQENFPNIKDLNLHIERTYLIPKKIDSDWSTLRHILIKQLHFKNKEKFLLSLQQKGQIIYRGKKVRFASYFSTAKYKVKRSETMFSRNSREKSENKNFISNKLFQVMRLLLKPFSACKNLGNPITPSPFGGIRERASAKKRLSI